MADLLPASVHAQIRGAIQDVFDTFADTTITYYRAGTMISDTMEDDIASFTPVTLKGIVEYTQDDSDKLAMGPTGRMDEAEVKVTLGYDDLDALGLITNNIPNVSTENDYFEINGERFSFILAIADGHFESNAVSIIFYGKKDQEKA